MHGCAGRPLLGQALRLTGPQIRHAGEASHLTEAEPGIGGNASFVGGGSAQLAEPLMHEERLRPAVLDDVGGLGRGEVPVDRGQVPARLQGGQVNLDRGRRRWAAMRRCRHLASGPGLATRASAGLPARAGRPPCARCRRDLLPRSSPDPPAPGARAPSIPPHTSESVSRYAHLRSVRTPHDWSGRLDPQAADKQPSSVTDRSISGCCLGSRDRQVRSLGAA